MMQYFNTVSSDDKTIKKLIDKNWFTQQMKMVYVINNKWNWNLLFDLTKTCYIKIIITLFWNVIDLWVEILTQFVNDLQNISFKFNNNSISRQF